MRLKISHKPGLFKFSLFPALIWFCSFLNVWSQNPQVYYQHYNFEQFVNPAITGRDLYPFAALSYKRYSLPSDFSSNITCLGGSFRMGQYDFYTPRKMLNKGKLYGLDITQNIAFMDSLRRIEVTLPEKKFEDSLKIELNTVIGADVFFELFDQNLKRVDFARVDYFEPGQNEFWIKPKKVMNAGYMLNIRVGNRPHGFFISRFKEVDWDELYRIRDSIQGR
jgi:hypothetical protein